MTLRGITNYIRLLTFVVAVFCAGTTVDAQLLQDDAHAEIFFSPRSGTFTEGSEFDVPLYVNTEGQSVGNVNISIVFDPDLLGVVRPSGGKSMFDHWIETPTYDNEKGVVHLLGEVTDGIVTDSGLISTISFKALGTGEATITIQPESSVHLYDGLKTKLKTTFGRASYSLVKKPTDGVRVFSETHTSSNRWYNNKSPILSWDTTPDIEGFSYELDDVPSTIPDNSLDSTATTISYNDLKDGVWYFHIKAKKAQAWQNTTHFLLKIDSVPPVEFTPTVNSLVASVISRNVISFRTYDSLSGIGHYEVGVIDAESERSEKPVFFESESPYSLPDDMSDTVQVVVRAFDKAGNVQEGALNINRQFRAGLLAQTYGVYALLTLLGLLTVFVLYHYLFQHHMFGRGHRMIESGEEESGMHHIHEVSVIERPASVERFAEREVQQIAPPPLPQVEPEIQETAPDRPATKQESPYLEYSLKRPASMPPKVSSVSIGNSAKENISLGSVKYDIAESVHYPDPVLPKYSPMPPAPSHEDPKQWPPNRVG